MALREFVSRLDHLRRMAAVAPVTLPIEGESLWLAPVLQRRFSTEDFEGMDAASLKDLLDRIKKFEELASRRNSAASTTSVETTPTDGSEVAAGYSLLTGIGELVDAHLGRSGPPEEESKIRDALNVLRTKYGSDLAPLDYEMRTDSNGDPGVWVWAGVPGNQNVLSPDFRTKIDAYRRDILRTFRRNGIDSWPYVGIRTPDEQKRLIYQGSR